MAMDRLTFRGGERVCSQGGDQSGEARGYVVRAGTSQVRREGIYLLALVQLPEAARLPPLGHLHLLHLRRGNAFDYRFYGTMSSILHPYHEREETKRVGVKSGGDSRCGGSSKDGEETIFGNFRKLSGNVPKSSENAQKKKCSEKV